MLCSIGLFFMFVVYVLFVLLMFERLEICLNENLMFVLLVI